MLEPNHLELVLTESTLLTLREQCTLDLGKWFYGCCSQPAPCMLGQACALRLLKTKQLFGYDMRRACAGTFFGQQRGAPTPLCGCSACECALLACALVQPLRAHYGRKAQNCTKVTVTDQSGKNFLRGWQF